MVGRWWAGGGHRLQSKENKVKDLVLKMQHSSFRLHRGGINTWYMKE